MFSLVKEIQIRLVQFIFSSVFGELVKKQKQIDLEPVCWKKQIGLSQKLNELTILSIFFTQDSEFHMKI